MLTTSLTTDDIEFTHTFNDTNYLVYINATPSKLNITLETINETNYWNGSWDSDELEEITIKAQSHKTFKVFNKMIYNALTGDSKIVKLELLSYLDLENLKKLKSNEDIGSYYKFHDPNEDENFEIDPLKVKTKFLIIKYTTDFEAAQFPLRLFYVDKPDEHYTTRTINRLRINQKSYDDLDNISRIELENLKIQITNLNGKIKLLECNRQNSAVENEEYLSSISRIKVDFEKYKVDAEKRVKDLNNSLNKLKNKMAAEGDTLLGKLQGQEQSFKNQIKELEKQKLDLINKMANKKEETIKMMEEQKEDFINLVKDLQHRKNIETTLRSKIDKLEKELELNEKQITKLTYLTKGKDDKEFKFSANKSIKSTKINKSNNKKYSHKKHSSNSNSSERTGKSTAKSNVTNKDSQYSYSFKNSENPNAYEEYDDHYEDHYNHNEDNYNNNNNKKGKAKVTNKHHDNNDNYEFNIRTNPFDKELDLTNLRVSTSNKLTSLNTINNKVKSYDMTSNINFNSRNKITTGRSGSGNKSVISSMSSSSYENLCNINAVSSGYDKKPYVKNIRVLSNNKDGKDTKLSKDSKEFYEVDILTKSNTKANAKPIQKDNKDKDDEWDNGTNIEKGLGKVSMMLKTVKK